MIVPSCLALFAGLLAAPDTSVPRPFRERVDAYVKLRDDAVAHLPKLPKSATPEQIQRHDASVLAAVQAARKQARQGDIFAADVRPLFLTILRSQFQGPSKKKLEASIEEGNPTGEKAPGEVTPKVAVNALYPKNAPLSTVPPSLLLRLPELPKTLEYRFVGRTLILRDAHANMIVDFLREAVPGT